MYTYSLIYKASTTYIPLQRAKHQPASPLQSNQPSTRTSLTSKRPPHSPRLIALQNILDTSIRAANQDAETNTQHHRIQNRETNILPIGIPFALLEDGEPKEGREIEREAADEQARDDAQEGVEEGNSLGNHPGCYREAGDEHQPDGPTLSRVNVAELRTGENAAHDVFADDCGVDGARDEDDGERDAERDARYHFRAGEYGGAFNVAANEGVNYSSGKSIDEDFDQTERPDGFDIIWWGMHFRHETVLTDSEGVGKDDVCR